MKYPVFFLMKYPVFFPVIREFTVERSSHLTASSATESAACEGISVSARHGRKTPGTSAVFARTNFQKYHAETELAPDSHACPRIVLFGILGVPIGGDPMHIANQGIR